MNSRERVQRILNFEPVDRTLDWEFGYWGGALNRWYKEGLTRKKGFPRELSDGEGVAGPGLHWPIVSFFRNILRDEDVSDYFNFDRGWDLTFFNCWLEPKFEQKIIREDKNYKEWIDENGLHKFEYKNGTAMPSFLGWPVTNHKDWEQIKQERFQPNFYNRFRRDFKELEKEYKNRDYFLGILGEPAGFYGSIRMLIGEENLLYMFYDNPKLIKDILNYLTDLWIDLGSELLSNFEIDAVFFWEDMCGKNGPAISPTMFREFITPCYKRIIGAMKSRGISHFIVDNDGNLDIILPLFIECGFTGIYPIEKQAGNNLLEMRRKYPKLQIMGGFNKNVLAYDKKAIDLELEDFKEMISMGGFIPFADHTIPLNSSWKNFKYYREKLKIIIYSTKVLK